MTTFCSCKLPTSFVLHARKEACSMELANHGGSTDAWSATMTRAHRGLQLNMESNQMPHTGEVDAAPKGEACGLGANGLAAGALPKPEGAAAPNAGACAVAAMMRAVLRANERH